MKFWVAGHVLVGSHNGELSFCKENDGTIEIICHLNFARQVDPIWFDSIPKLIQLPFLFRVEIYHTPCALTNLHLVEWIRLINTIYVGEKTNKKPKVC